MMKQMRNKLAIGSWLILAFVTGSMTAARDAPKDLDAPSRTILGITLGQSNLTMVQTKLGAAKLWGMVTVGMQRVRFVT